MQLARCIALLASLLPLTSVAQELTPRTYWPAPVGTQLISAGLVFSEGDTVPDASLPVTGLDSSITTAYLAYARTLNLLGRSSNFIIELPYSDGDTQANHLELGSLRRDYKGMGDIAATLSINLMGAPTMTREEFAVFRSDPKPMLGASLKVVAPTGKYDNDRIINVGANRWAAKAELGYMTVLHPRWLLELELGAWFFEDNDDFLGRTREQDPIYAAEVHLVHRFKPGFWASLDLNGYRGGTSTFDGRRLNDLQRDSKFGTTWVFPIARLQALKFSYAFGSVNDSDESFDVFSVSYQRLF